MMGLSLAWSILPFRCHAGLRDWFPISTTRELIDCVRFFGSTSNATYASCLKRYILPVLVLQPMRIPLIPRPLLPLSTEGEGGDRFDSQLLYM